MGAAWSRCAWPIRPQPSAPRTRLTPMGSSEISTTTEHRLVVQDAGRAIVDVVRSLDGAGLMPEWLTVREPTLDDVFSN